MHEVRVTVGQERVADIVRMAHAAGIDRISATPVFIHGADRSAVLLSAETSTPRARALVDALLGDGGIDLETDSLSTRELRGIIGSLRIPLLTRPVVEPVLNVLEDLFQLSHVTPSYVARAGAAALLLTYGMLKNDTISIVVAALFMPFLSDVLATAFGIWAADYPLARQGLRAMMVSALLAATAGALVAWLVPVPMAFEDFKRPLASAAISSVIGVAAGFSTADDAGRRYLIGVAAAVQYAIYPAWVGICLIRGFPERSIVVERLATFGINVATIAAAAVTGYVLAGVKRAEARRAHRH